MIAPDRAALSGSIGMVLAVPITAVIAGFLYGYGAKTKRGCLNRASFRPGLIALLALLPVLLFLFISQATMSSTDLGQQFCRVSVIS